MALVLDEDIRRSGDHMLMSEHTDRSPAKSIYKIEELSIL
jgi:hypothetical protein